MARSGPTKTRTRPSGAHRARKKPLDDEGIIPILARAVREVESAAGRGKVTGQNRTKFQVAALLIRDERSRAKESTSITPAAKQEILKRLDGLAAIMAKTAARDFVSAHMFFERGGGVRVAGQMTEHPIGQSSSGNCTCGGKSGSSGQEAGPRLFVSMVQALKLVVMDVLSPRQDRMYE